MQEKEELPNWNELGQSLLLPTAATIGIAGVLLNSNAPNVPLNLDWRPFAAGAIGGAVSHGYCTPIDVVKTRMQTNPELYGGSVVNAIGCILREEGPAFFFQGLLPTALGYGIEVAAKFGVYEASKPLFSQFSDSDFLNFLGPSLASGLIAAVIICPFEAVRIRQVSDPEFAPNSLAALSKLLRTEGPLAQFRGLNAMLGKQVPVTATKQISFDIVTSTIKKLASGVDPEVLTALSSVITAILACIASQPGDVVLSTTYKQSEKENPQNAWEILTEIIDERGLQGIFLGIKPRLGHAIAILTPQLLIYDAIKQMLGLPATGSR